MNPNLIIDVKGLTKSFDDKIVVDNVNLSVNKGEVFGFLGPNGSGKTTTIRMLCGLLTPDSGQGYCLEYDIVKESQMIRRHVGYMTQKFSLYLDLSVRENLMFIGRLFLLDQLEARVDDMMETLSLTTYQHHLAAQLSGGWRQTLALGACLIHEPKLLLLDEPTAGVDPFARRVFWDKIHDLSEKGVTTLVSTHYMDEAERCSRLTYLAYGKILIDGTLKDVIHSIDLIGFEISGAISTTLLSTIKQLEGVTQAVYFGDRIHVCGQDGALIRNQLDALIKGLDIEIKSIDISLEDAFIRLSDIGREGR